MLRLGRVAVACALAAVLVAALAPAAAAQDARPTALLAVWQASPAENLSFAGREPPYEPADLFLRSLERHRLSIGLLSSVQGDYSHEQALLDISQGTRQSTFIYQPKDYPRLGLQRLDGSGRIARWDRAVRRAATASTTIRPGLLASSIPGGAGYAGVTGRNADGAIPAADERGRVAAVSIGPAATLAARAQGLLASKRLVVVSLPSDPSGARALDQLVAARRPGELLIVTHLPFTPPPKDRSVTSTPTRYYKQPAFGLSDGTAPGSVVSATTRQAGLVSAIDVAPTILTHLGLAVPNRMRGERIEPAGRISAERLEGLRRRWSDVRSGRQSASLRAVAAAAAVMLLALGAWRGAGRALAPALRVGALGLMWWPTTVLLAAAVEPKPLLLESALIALPALLLGALSDRLLPWPRAPVLPAVAALALFTVDLAGLVDLMKLSTLGPSLAFGARFYGISNELEPLFPIMLLLALAAVLSGRPPPRRAALLYAGSGIVLGLVVGSGRLGADVGGVLTVAGGMTVATLVMLPGGVTRRSLAIAALVPVAALAALIVIDLVFAGGGHLSRNLVRAENAQELWELVARRYELAFQSLVRGRTPAYFAAAGLGVAFAWRNRELFYGGVRGEPTWRALLLGGLAAGIVGMLTNDSGPVLLINAVMALGAVTAYLVGRPGLTVADGDAGPSSPTARQPAGRPSADPVLAP